MVTLKEALVFGVMVYGALGIHALNLVLKGVSKEGWLFNLARYHGRMRILAEAWEAVFSLLTALFAFFCWWLVLPMYYTGPIARERRKAKSCSS
ncbi:MAG TPA: hypothetical protein VG964_01970 [Candidatus Saccharimonadales bacterium]|nr:hypothetical protein [Candidatus Saccharimonadales bacterium]